MNLLCFPPYVGVCLVLSAFWRSCTATIKVGGPDGEQKLTFKAPTVSDEEAHSNFMPDQLKCDACRVVAYQIHTKFKQFNNVHKQFKNNLPESEILSVLEDACENPETFNTYGLKEVDGNNRLSGEGLETKDSPGIISGGGKWPTRLMRMCSSFVEELGEEELYAIYRKNSNNHEQLVKILCEGNGIFAECSRLYQRHEL